MTRALTILGTAAQSPTATRNQNGYLLRWDEEVILFDPGEGTQRQMLLARASVAGVTRICITHFHGDHCLGLPGVLQRRSLDPEPDAIDLHYPASGHPHLEALLAGTEWDTESLELRLHPTDDGSSIDLDGHSRLIARALDHTVDALGWRIEETARRHLDARRLAALGIEGADRSVLRERGWYERGAQHIDIDAVSTVTDGQRFAFIMDTRRCLAAQELAEAADLLVIESTYLDREAALAGPHGHLTARDAAEIAREAKSRRTVLTHFSDRYADLSPFAEETRDIVDDCIVATDLTVVAVPRRQTVD
jgi:ribonuclease Z